MQRNVFKRDVSDGCVSLPSAFDAWAVGRVEEGDVLVRHIHHIVVPHGTDRDPVRMFAAHILNVDVARARLDGDAVVSVLDPAVADVDVRRPHGFDAICVGCVPRNSARGRAQGIVCRLASKFISMGNRGTHRSAWGRGRVGVSGNSRCSRCHDVDVGDCNPLAVDGHEAPEPGVFHRDVVYPYVRA